MLALQDTDPHDDRCRHRRTGVDHGDAANRERSDYEDRPTPRSRTTISTRLTDANVGTDSDAVSAKTWSQVDLQNTVTFAAAHGPVLIRPMSSIHVATIKRQRRRGRRRPGRAAAPAAPAARR